MCRKTLYNLSIHYFNTKHLFLLSYICLSLGLCWNFIKNIKVSRELVFVKKKIYLIDIDKDKESYYEVYIDKKTKISFVL
jgi:hypothetical protein